MTTINERTPLSAYLDLGYRFDVIADPDGGYVIRFPDLPGCLTQVDSIDDVGPAADEIKTLWIETEYERGAAIPPPTYPEPYSGKFNLRLPKSLHRRLVELAELDAVSLNQLIVSMLSEGAATHGLSSTVRELAAIETEMREALSLTRGDAKPVRMAKRTG